jgi:hypothetical protein
METQAMTFVPMIADAGGADYAWRAIELVWSAGISYWMWRISSSHKDQKGLETRLHETTTKLIDERFRSMSHEVRNHMQVFISAIDEMKNKVKEADGEAKKLNDRDHEVELNVINKIDELKDYIRERAASASDLKRHEDNVNKRFEALENTIRTKASSRN